MPLLPKFMRRRCSDLLRDKLDAIDYAFARLKMKSFADLGGVWGVECGYSFHTLDGYPFSNATLVDTHPTPVVRERAKRHGQLRLLVEDFGNANVVSQIGSVDAVFLFDVLLHQVSPNWDAILRLYAPHTRCFVVYNQMWIGSERTERLLDLGESQYFENVPHPREEPPYDALFGKLDTQHPDHEKLWRDVHHIWQWGITNADLQTEMAALGFQLRYLEECGQFCNLRNFRNYAYVFVKEAGCLQ